jgi:hypothetical protein
VAPRQYAAVQHEKIKLSDLKTDLYPTEREILPTETTRVAPTFRRDKGASILATEVLDLQDLVRLGLSL